LGQGMTYTHDCLGRATGSSFGDIQHPLGGRRVDILTHTGQAKESKVGRTSLTSDVRAQIAKDEWLLDNEPSINRVEWKFSRSSVTGQVGPTGPLAAALEKAGINWSLVP
jgi:hypothetical protein